MVKKRFASRMPTHAMKPHEWGTRRLNINRLVSQGTLCVG
jgi:hypothetical protein